MKTITTIEITDEMVEQMKDALAELFNQRLGPEDAPYIPSDFNGLAEDELTAVLPIIEKQMREQCADEIEAVMIEEAPGKVHNDPVIYMRNIGFQRGLKYAARIVREEE